MYSADQALMNKWVRNRDAQAFKSIASKYGGTVYGASMRILRNASDAEDVTQQCFLALANIKGRLPDSMGAWLHRIATHQAINYRRSDQRRRAREERFALSMSAVTEANWDDVSHFVDEAIDELPDKLRVAIIAHFFEDQSITAIAVRENVTHGAISQRVQKAVSAIRESLERRGVTVTAIALAAMLADSALAAPVCSAALAHSLGKIALSGGALGKAKLPIFSLTSKVLSGVATAIVLAAGTLFLLPSADTPTADAAHADELDKPSISADGSARSNYLAPVELGTVADSLPRISTTALAAMNKEETIKDWREVVEAYAAHQDKIRNITIDYTQSSIGDNFYADFGYPAGHREAFERVIFTTDGERCYTEQYRWGNWLSNVTTPANQPMLNACVWNGKVMIEYSAAGGDRYGKPGSIQVHNDALNSKVSSSAFDKGRSYLLYSRYGNAAMLGYPLEIGQRIEDVLRNARVVTLRSSKERAAGQDCYVLDAETSYGVFAVWFDPTHAFNIAQYTLHQRPGDLHGKRGVESNRVYGYTYIVPKFADVDGLWVPKESTLRVQRLVNGVVGDDHTHHQVRTAIILNNDNDPDSTYALRADYILDGAEWYEFGPNTEILAEYTWRGGQLYTKSGEKAQQWPKSTGYGRGALISSSAQ